MPPLSKHTIATLRAGLAWLYDTEQPDGAITQHHGRSTSTGDWRLGFCPLGADDLPVVWVEVATPVYRTIGDDRLLTNPLGPHAMKQISDALAQLGHPVTKTWNGESHMTTGSCGMRDPAHPTLLAAVQRYHAGCPTHKSLFCGNPCSDGGQDCPWYRDGEAKLITPEWPPTPTVFPTLRPEGVELLRDVADDQVYRVKQRTATYAMNRRTGRRVTKRIKWHIEVGLVKLAPSDRWRDGVYELTADGEATLAWHSNYPQPTPQERTANV